MAEEGSVSKQTTGNFEFEKLSQPFWRQESAAVAQTPLEESIIYKGTRTGLVVERCVALFPDRCVTYHDTKKTTDEMRTWVLDKGCSLKPATAAELEPKKRGFRPRGKWAITAVVEGVETYLDLYELTIDWPTSWAAAGYTSLDLAFRDRALAEHWHAAITAVLVALRGSKSTRLSTVATMSAPSPDLKTVSAPVAASSPLPASASVRVTADADEAVAVDDLEQWADPGGDADLYGSDDGEGDSSEADEPDAPAGPGEERWVPYRQTNGVAIYRHSGGEYMVSCTIRGRPAAVAAALMRLRGNTTLLGPAAAAEVLQPAEGPGGGGKEVVRLVLTASGAAGLCCAPREVVLERMRRDEEDGVIVIMFKSVDLPHEASAQGGGAGAGLYGSGLYRKPVRGSVAGGYTIAGLKGEGAASRESLITCIVKVELGGVCDERSWARPIASALGWTDAFLERILMSVHLLRDEVEQRRFSVQPFKLVSSAKARFNEDGELVGDPAAARAAAVAAATVDAAAGPAAGGASSSFSAAAGGGAGRPPPRMASLRVASVGGGGAATAEAAAAAVAAAAARRAGITPIGEEGEEQEVLGPEAALIDSMRLDVAYVQSLATVPRQMWAEIHVPGTDAPFNVRGPTYLKDRKKVPAGQPAFSLGAVELVVLPPPGTLIAGKPLEGVAGHLARFIPSIRQGGAPFSIIINLVVPGVPLLGLVVVFCCDKHPSILGSPPQNPMEEKHDWQPFDFVLHKFVYGSDETRNRMLKLIPHIASGTWMIKQSVGTTPVILGNALKTTYHCTPTYIEVDIDISANSVANYVTGMVRGATSSLDVDLGFVLEGTAPWELPECLLGALRLKKLNCSTAPRELDWSTVLPVTAGKGGA